MSVDLVIHDVRLVDGGAIVADAWVAFRDGAVAGRGSGDGWRALAVADHVDGGGGILTPGFLDIHGHGGGGHAYDEGAEAIQAARALHRAHGTTRAVVSLVTAPVDILVERVALVADLAERDPEILGSHLEGPFLDPGHRGAHDAALLRRPEPAAVDRLIAAGRGTIRQVTLAPELPGSEAAAARLRADGAAVAVGHTDADFAVAARAFAEGAGILTHAFNAMRGLHHREPGPVGAALADPRVFLELIADGVHVHDSLIRVLFAAAPGRIVLVTDAMAAAGAPDGAYRLGALEVVVRDGAATLADGGAIAGSTATQDAILRRVVGAGVGLADAVHALTAAPARAIGVHRRFGALSPGCAADAVLLDDDLRVRTVWVEGRRAA